MLCLFQPCRARFYRAAAWCAFVGASLTRWWAGRGSAVPFALSFPVSNLQPPEREAQGLFGVRLVLSLSAEAGTVEGRLDAALSLIFTIPPVSPRTAVACVAQSFALPAKFCGVIPVLSHIVIPRSRVAQTFARCCELCGFCGRLTMRSLCGPPLVWICHPKAPLILR